MGLALQARPSANLCELSRQGHLPEPPSHPCLPFPARSLSHSHCCHPPSPEGISCFSREGSSSAVCQCWEGGVWKEGFSFGKGGQQSGCRGKGGLEQRSVPQWQHSLAPLSHRALAAPAGESGEPQPEVAEGCEWLHC